MNLTKSQHKLLIALSSGHFLKSHRFLDGTKVFQMHALDGQTSPAARQDVTALVEKGYVSSNQKFPAATYMLTEKGGVYAATHTDEISG